jgi:hypothetical protein
VVVLDLDHAQQPIGRRAHLCPFSQRETWADAPEGDHRARRDPIFFFPGYGAEDLISGARRHARDLAEGRTSFES